MSCEQHDWVDDERFNWCTKCKARYYHNIGEREDDFDSRIEPEWDDE